MTHNAITRSLVGLTAAFLLVTTTGCLPEETAQDSSATSASAGKAGKSRSSDKTPRKKAQKASVPRVRGLSQRDAEKALTAAGLVVGKVTKVPSARKAGTVLRQGARGGAATTAGAAVALVLAVPYPAVPTIVGRSQRAASDILRSAGFAVQVDEETRTSGRDGAVLSQTPAGDVLLKPGATVTIVVAHVVVPVAPPVSHSCSPGYTPCLAPASDYDCAGGSGDGPRYTGLVHVTGSDQYDLDRDGDGLGCD